DANRLYRVFGKSIFLFIGSVLQSPLVPQEKKDELSSLKGELFPRGLLGLIENNADKASFAKKKLPLLSEKASILKGYSLPDGKTLYDHAEHFLQSGIALDRLMSQRATLEAGGKQRGRFEALRLRMSTLETLNNCRRALSDELKKNQKLPRN